MIDGLSDLEIDSALVTEDGVVVIAGTLSAARRPVLRVGLDGRDLGPALLTAMADGAAGRFRLRFDGSAGPRQPGSLVRLALEADGPSGRSRREIAVTTAPRGTEAAEALLAAETILIGIDIPTVHDGHAAIPDNQAVEIQGWALGLREIARVAVAIDGTDRGTVHLGIRRWDVQAVFPHRDASLMCGFALCLPRAAIPAGTHRAVVTAVDTSGAHRTLAFTFTARPVVDDPDWWRPRRPPAPGPVAARPRAAGTRDEPAVVIVLALPADATAQALLDTLASVARQTRPPWRLAVDAPEDRLRELTAGLTGAAAATLRDALPCPAVTALLAGGGDGPDAATWLWPIRAGDLLAADAVADLCAAADEAPEADLIYGDERCHNIAIDAVEAFRKPGWSPELLLSTNYLGRAFAVRLDLARRAALAPADLADPYDLALRATERAAAVAHVEAVLSERAPDGAADTPGREAEALRRAMARRGLPYAVEPGRLPGTYRLRSTAKRDALVSIIIPTCAAGGLVERCITSLKRLTAYRRFEIIVVDNIRDPESPWKPWLRAEADVVLDVPEPFNWSRFNNLAAREARGTYLLFLNDDTEVLEPDWLDAMLDAADLPGVGVVGARLLFPDGTVQHAGMHLTPEGARHTYYCAQGDDPCDFGL